ncbi:MAG: hypothetical protein ACLTW0_01910 [Alistipes ihumii]|jgi:hypothetical protein|uniref:hypothetical protein n=1 Tax=Alistipes ihumii TaxID=1470347 RepID=UPI000D7B7CAA|nr:MAG: hypothetical protein DBY24_07035 [Prevotellaceae bacterium]
MDKDIFMFGDGGNSSVASLLPALMQNRGMDPNLVAALMNGNNNRSAWGGDGCWLLWIILLWAICGGNGWGGNGMNSLPAQLNGDAGRELLMNAIQGNGSAITQLASSLNCSVQQIQTAICSLQGSIDKVAGQVGMTGQQVINAIQAGNNQIAAQMAECCCNVRTMIQQQGYESQLATCNQTNTLVNTANQNTLALRDAGTANTNAIIGKLDQMQTQALQDKIDALREKNSTLLNQLSQEHQTAAFGQMIGQATTPIVNAVNSLQNDVNGIKCKLPETATVPYSPIVGVPTCVAAQYGIGFGVNGWGNGFWG